MYLLPISSLYKQFNLLTHLDQIPSNDEVVWQQLKQGNKRAFTQLFKKYYAPLYDYGIHIVKNQNELLKDTLQDLFTEIWAKRNRLGEVNHVKTYLFKSFRRNLLRALKKQRKFLLLFDNRRVQPDAFSLSIEDLMISKEIYSENQQKIEDAFQKLTTSQKEIIYLKFKDNLDYEEIEEITSLKYQSIRNAVHRALKSMRTILYTHSQLRNQT